MVTVYLSRYVIAMKPTYFEKGASERTELLEWDEKNDSVWITYCYQLRGIAKRFSRKAIICNKVTA